MLYVPSASVCVTGGIQPGPLVRAMTSNTENGLLARLLLAQPPRIQKVWTTATIGFATMADMRMTFKALLADGRCETDKYKVIEMTPTATEAFKKFYAVHGQELWAASGALAAMLAKVEAYAARLALIDHVVSVGKDSQIEPASVEAGVVLARWFAREARRIYGSALTGPTADTAADAAAHWLAGQPEGFGTIRDITHGPRRFRSRPASAEEAATKLIREGRAVRYVRPSGDAGGRPADGIRLVVAP